MSLAIVYTRASLGLHAPLVTVEVHLGKGLPRFSIVGLPETAVKESRERVRSALLNSGFEFPARRTTINLAPADLPKEGCRFDLPIALGILAASEQIPKEVLANYEFAGELALTGELRPIKASLPFALATHEAKRAFMLPRGCADEAGLIEGVALYPANHILEVSAHLSGEQLLPTYTPAPHTTVKTTAELDLKDVYGQHHAKRALTIAAAGGHSLLMAGPPGTGKTMLASRLPSILPVMSQAESLESAAIASISHHGIDYARWRKRPFRAPHHTASAIALVGGGSTPRPGEISLAHHGVLFLDELPEFQRRVLEVLREPLESGHITISRAAQQVQFPAQFQLIAAMNPCPCGYYGDPRGQCRCTTEQVQRYQNRLSGPLLDRIDMHVTVPALPPGSFQKTGQDETPSCTLRKQVEQARAQQHQRSQTINAHLSGETLTRTCQLAPGDRTFLDDAMQKLGLSARVYHRVLKVARTIADLDNRDAIHTAHLEEGLMFNASFAHHRAQTGDGKQRQGKKGVY